MSTKESESATPSGGVEDPQPRAEGLRGWLLTAGEWLQRPPGKHMGLQTTLVVLVIMVILVWVGGWFS